MSDCEPAAFLCIDYLLAFASEMGVLIYTLSAWVGG